MLPSLHRFTANAILFDNKGTFFLGSFGIFFCLEERVIFVFIPAIPGRKKPDSSQMFLLNYTAHFDLTCVSMLASQLAV